MPLPAWPRLPPSRALWRALAAVCAASALLVFGEALVRAHLETGLGATATRYYARPRLLQPGTRLDRGSLERYLQRLSYQRRDHGRVGVGQYRFNGGTWSIGRRAFRVADQLDAGGMTDLYVDGDGWITGLRNAQGGWISRVMLEPEPLRAPGPPGDDRVPVRLRDVPQPLVDAVVTIEDQHFFSHSGIDFVRILGAGLANVRAGEIEQGASTITQQLAKNLFLSSRRSPIRKIRELAMALVLEARYSKQELLEAYLNAIYLGQDGAYAVRGVARAAQFYFGKDLSQLGLAESALLAALIRGPNLYQPLRHPEAATARRNRVLDVMRAHDLITAAEYRSASKAPLGVRRTVPPARAGRYFVDLVAEQQGPERGVTVFTTLDMDLEIAAEAAVGAGVATLEREHPELRRADSPLQAALVALDPRTGEILAMVGGRDYGGSQFNRATQARRQPGSAFKPIVALAALSGGEFTLATHLQDEPLSVETPVGLWEPTNYDGQFRGPVTLRTALESSLNVPFARLGLEVGPDRIASTARRLGIESPLRTVPSLALGSSEVTPLEMARAFGVFAAEGFRADPHAVLGTLDGEGKVMQRAQLTGEQVYTAPQTYLVTSALEGAVERGTGRGLRAWGYQGPVAAKSGTTNDFRDAWFVGFTPTLAIAVWVGFDDGRTIGLSGSQAALPIFARFLTATTRVRDEPDVPPPAELEIVDVDPMTGLAADPRCGGEPEYFLPGTAPQPGEGCWGLPSLPSWVADAEARVTDGVRLLLQHLRDRLRRARP